MKITNNKIVPYEDLLDFPRYTPVKTILLDRVFQLADSASYYYSFKEIFVDGIYEFACDTEDPVIIDCGVNIGTGLIYFKSLYPKSRIIGFEADPYIFGICRSNLEAFQINDIQLENLAVWNEDVELEFMSEGADGGRIDCLLTDVRKIRVKARRLSQYIIDEVDLLKIDIEGAEAAVLSEIRNKLHFVKNLFVEYHSFTNKPQNLSLILAILENAGFRYHVITQMGAAKPLINHMDNLGMDNQLNIYCYRK